MTIRLLPAMILHAKRSAGSPAVRCRAAPALVAAHGEKRAYPPSEQARRCRRRAAPLGPFGSLLQHAKTLEGFVLSVVALDNTARSVLGDSLDPVAAPSRNDCIYRVHFGTMA